MARVRFTASAAADSAAILSHLNTEAVHQIASKFGNRCAKLYDRLAGHPESGAPRPALGPNIRIGIVSPYIVIYRYIEADDLITVLRIVHGHRKIAGKLLVR